MAKKKTRSAKPVDAIKHTDRRANIPTEELRDFVPDDEHSAETKLYPRDPSLDPQLVWKDKDEQDAEDLAVPVVPIYIQEKIHPQAVIEDFRRSAYAEGVAEEAPAYQFNLFNDFNGLEDDDFARKLDFYSHDTESQPHWSNRLILGDSLLVMNSLAEKERLKGRVQMIYIDPPYGIKFGSNWQVSTRKRSVSDTRTEDITRQPEQIRAFRDTWQLGIHSYLTYLRDRLITARELLTETGSIFVQIGDENVHLVRCLMDEVFGSENFCSVISVQKTGQKDSKTIDSVSDYLIWYAKEVQLVKYRQLYLRDKYSPLIHKSYRFIRLSHGLHRSLNKKERNGYTSLPVGARPYQSVSLHSQDRTANTETPVVLNGQEFFCPPNRHWSNDPEVIEKAFRYGYVEILGNTPRRVIFFDETPGRALNNIWSDTMGADDPLYVVQTNTKVIQRCILMTTDPGDLVLDPTCGSGTTAVVAEQWGRRWISIDTSRVALALARTRLMSARYPYYLLTDSPEGIKKDAELMEQEPPDHPTGNDIKKGFVYKREPNITLKFIANNPDIDVIYERWQKELDPLREKINGLGKKNYQEWEIPREVKRGPQALKDAIARWWDIKKERQTEIDEIIARYPDGKIMYDHPYENNKRVRVTGPFTVESLSPHRVLATDENMDGTVSEQEARKQQDFTSVILENMYKAGVQNTRKDERLKFDRLEPYAGTWVHAEGDYTDADGQSRRVAVSIGPEHGTVGPLQVKEAAKEAVQGLGFDLLIVGGFAFDPHVSEESERYGRLTVLPTHMNPDLAMGDELLKKTGAGNLFMIFGEPDIALHPQDDGKLSLELLGVDVYDPTTGALRCNSTDEVACWFIDTEYNGESFFVRHAYFTGADRPYDKLKRALRSEIDEDAWSDLYTTQSRAFDPPDSGKIAVKVINHYGDEVLKVYDIDQKNKIKDG